MSHVHVKRENWSLQYRRAGISRRGEIPSPKTYDNDLLLMQMCSVLHTKRGFSTSVSTLFVEIGAAGQNFHNARLFGWHGRVC